MALGSQPRAGQKDPEVIEARHTIIEACKRHGVPAGIHTPSSKVALEMVAEGFQLTTIASDDRFLMTMAKEEIAAMRAGLKNS